MLKHPDLTLGRIDLFFKSEVEGRFVVDRENLSIEVNEHCASNQSEAEAGPFRAIEPGFRYGPAYRRLWFRIRGDVPDRMKGRRLAVLPEVGGERTVWRDGSPVFGIDDHHPSFDWDVRWGDKIDLLVEATCRNPQCRLHLKEPPREPLVEKVEGAEIVAIDETLLGFAFDFDFARHLLKILDRSDPNHASLMRGLNHAINSYSTGGIGAVERCRKILRHTISNLTGEMRHTVVPVGHAHLDTAWLWPISVAKKKMAHTTASQLALMEKYPEHVFAHSQASQYEWLELEYPILFERVKEAAKRGQWEPVGSMWVEADCNLTGGESLVRQFLYGRRYFREKLGYETHDTWLPDVFGYSAALPQILDKFGIRYFLTQKMSWNQFNRFPHNTFWWQGIDGTKIWTHFPPADTYSGTGEPEEIIESVKHHRDHGRSDLSLYLFGWGDGGGGPTERHLEFLRRGRVTPCYPELAEQKKAIEFFREAREASRDLATWVGELYFEYHRGTYTTQAANKKANRRSEFLMRDAEWLACFSEGFPAKYPAEELERAWKLVLINQFHDIIPGTSVREVYADSATDYEQVDQIGRKIVEESLKKIGGKFDTTKMKQPVALFQNSIIPTQGEIAWSAETGPNSLEYDEESLPVQLVEEFGERKIIFPTPTAALGSVCVANISSEPASIRGRLKVSTRRLEDNELSVRFDFHGNITSITSLEDGSEFIEQGKLANLFQIFEDKPLAWSAWDIDAYALETGRDLVRSDSFEVVEKGPVRAAVETVKTFGSSRIRQRISLGPTPGLRFDTEIDWREEDKLLKVAFPVNVNASRATYEIQFGNVERPTHSNTSWDMAQFEVCAQKWVDLSEGDQGVAILNDGKYGHDIKGNLMRLTLLRSPKAPDPGADMGRHRFTYVLLPHINGYHYAGVVHAAYALNAPVRSVMLERSRGEAGLLPPFIEVEDRNLVIETVKRAEDGGGIIARLYECHNSRGIAELSCMRGIRSAVLTDLEENEMAELEVIDGVVRLPYKPFEILTVRLRCD